MSVTISGDTGVSKVQDGVIVQADLASGVAGTGPAFSAIMSADQTISLNTNTKITFNSEQFDTNNCYDAVTNYRFTPNVAGYYLITSTANISTGGVANPIVLNIYKNGSAYARGRLDDSSGQSSASPSVSCVMYMNGTTDYVESYAYVNGTGTGSVASGVNSIFSGVLVRAA